MKRFVPVSLLLVVLGPVAACGADSGDQTSALGAVAPSAAAPVTSPSSLATADPTQAVPGTRTDVQPAVDGERLTRLYSYGRGSFALQPPPQTYMPHVTAAAALKAFADTHLYEEAVVGRSPLIFLATLRREGDPASERQVWAVVYSNVEDYAVGPPPVPGEKATPARAVLHDVTGVVDADSGTLLAVESAGPDAVAAVSPPPVKVDKPQS